MVSQSQTQSAHSSELLLKFSCSACNQILNVGIDRMDEIEADCPRCNTPIKVPTLDRNVGGVETILQSNPETLRLRCPECKRPSKTSVRVALKKWTCPACKTPSKLKLAAPKVKIAVAAPSSSQPTSAPVAVKQTRDTSDEMRETADWTQTNETEEVIASHESDSEAVVYGSTPPKESSSTLFSDFLSGLSPRTLYRVIWFILQFPGYLLILLPLAHESTIGILVILTIIWFAPRLAICKRLTDFLLVQFVKSFQCPHCSSEYEAVGRWSCSCGYVDHKEQHFYAFRCPMCKGILGRTNCERCDATIILR